MYEKLIKCAAKMLCILKRLKTGFEIQSYIPCTHEMKNRILSKRCLFLNPSSRNISTVRILDNVCPKIFFFSRIWGGQLPPLSPSPTPT